MPPAKPTTTTTSSSPPLSPSSSFIEHPDPDDDDDHHSQSPESLAEHRRRTRNRILLIIFSLILLAGIAAVIVRSGVLFSGSPSPDDYNANIPVDTHSNTLPALQAKIQALCHLTDFPEPCVSALSDSADPHSADPRSLLVVTIQTAINAVEATLNYSAGLDRAHFTPRACSGFRECEEELLTLALHELGASRGIVSGFGLNGFLPIAVANLRDGLSAAVAFEETCTDGLSATAEAVPEVALRSTEWMLELLKNATEATRNSLAIVSAVSSRMEGSYEAAAQAPRGGTRKLAEEEAGKLWRSVEDRKKADVVVAKDGSGDCRSISEALRLATRDRKGRFVIYVKEGVYHETVRVSVEMVHVTMYGDGPDRTVVAGNRSVADGSSVYGSATFAVSGYAFMAINMGFCNTASSLGSQGVALRVQSDLSVFYNCHVDGYDSTLHAHAHRQFYRECVISGVSDIITGDAAVVFQNCHVVVKKPPPGRVGVVTAQSRVDRHEATGISMQNCTITAVSSPQVVQAVLGRPAKQYSRVVIMQSELGEVILPEAWGVSGGGGDDKTVYLAEFENRGEGAELKGRVKWEGYHVLRDVGEVAKFTTGEFIQGIWWLNKTGVPFYTGVLAAN